METSSASSSLRFGAVFLLFEQSGKKGGRAETSGEGEWNGVASGDEGGHQTDVNCRDMLVSEGEEVPYVRCGCCATGAVMRRYFRLRSNSLSATMCFQTSISRLVIMDRRWSWVCAPCSRRGDTRASTSSSESLSRNTHVLFVLFILEARVPHVTDGGDDIRVHRFGEGQRPDRRSLAELQPARKAPLENYG